MLGFSNFNQKSPQQRFLFILGVFMILIFFSLSIVLIFFSQSLSIDDEKFPAPYRIAFGVLLIVYASIRFNRLMKQGDNDR